MAAPSAASSSSITTSCPHPVPGKPTEASTDQFAGDAPSPAHPPLGIAVFGAGIIASDAHHRALLALHSRSQSSRDARTSVCVKAVWSRTSTKAEVLADKYASSKESCEAYHGSAGIAAVLERADIDAVVLAVPIAELAFLSIHVRKAGKHVLSEKPVAHCVAAAREAILYKSPNPTLHAVAENFRFEAGIVAAAIDAARLNPVCISLVAAMHMPPGSRFATPWRLAPRHVGAQLLDGGVHFVAALRMAARSDVVKVAASTSTASMHLPPPDSTSAMLSFANGVHATMVISYAASEFVWEMRVIATEGDLCLKRVKGTPAYVLETRLNGKSVTKQFPFSGIEEEFKCFVQCCRDKKIDKRIDARTAFNDLATIEAIVKSAETGEAVRVESLEDEGGRAKSVAAAASATGSSSRADGKRK